MGNIATASRVIDLSSFEPKDEVLDKVFTSRFDVMSSVPQLSAVIMREGIKTLTKQNFSIASGLEGSRKTWFCLSVASAFFNEYLGFEGVEKKGVLLWIDTEQGDEDLCNLVNRFYKITRLPKTSNNIIFLAMREYNPSERSEMTAKAIEYYKPDLVILDGGADLLTKGVNDEQNSTEAVNDLMRWSKIHDCHILNVVHNSHGNDKARGHYGSTALRKCETAYVLTADGDITEVKHAKTRKKRPNDFAFKIDESTELPILTTKPVVDIKQIKLENLFKELLPPPNSTTYSDLVRKIIDHKSVKESQAKKDVKSAVEYNILESKDGFYSLSLFEDSASLPF